MASAQDAPEVKHLQVEGASLAYVEEGSGVPVVFVHGALSDLRTWDRYRPMISDQRRFIAYTQRYFGPEKWPDDAKHFSTETHIKDLIAFVEGLDAGPVHLVTWSYSGEIGTHAALRRPDLFLSLVHYEPYIASLLSGVPGAAAANRAIMEAFGPAMAALE
ncbi:MAG TPA: alpha/beta fold hydrolase, partial [Paracoccaceae bacterium]|nr:alpha/beta fold hydrolase [Paracoccaceae bacterium]